MPDRVCTCENPVWVAGLVYVSEFDVSNLYEETKGKRRIECERCDGIYDPNLSADAYA